MKLSDKQAHYLLAILFDTCRLYGPVAGISDKDRLMLYNQIIDQQSEELIELDEEKNKAN